MRGFDEVERCLNAASSAGIRPGLDRVRRLLALLGDPQDAWPAFHVVGTNGKGSTCAFLAAVLQASGYRVALYTSPHLESLGERLLMDGQPLDPEAWLASADRVIEAAAGDEVLRADPPTYFELITAAAFLLAVGADVAVVEAGMGGRLDATNLLGRVAATAVASISMDHMEFLGDTLEAVAGEKFAVARRGVPACFAGREPSLVPLFRRACVAVGAPSFVLGQDARLENVVVSEGGCSFDFHGPGLDLTGVRTQLMGRHQAENGALALLTLSQVLGRFPQVSHASILSGMEAARWPGRLESVSESPLVVLDGGHNPDGVRRLVQSAAELWPGRRIGVVYAVMRDKDYQACLGLLASIRPALYPTAVPGMGRCLGAEELTAAALARTWRNVPRAFESPMAAIEASTGENDVTLVCGSLYLVGWVRGRLREEG